jgi:type I restriction-modification system DNA methylase subunit
LSIEESFAENALNSFQKIVKEIEKGSSEHDVRYRFVKYFVEEVLGYEPKYIKWEKKRADLTIIDENDFAVIKIETKKPTVNINKPEHEEQAFKYEEEATRYIGLTNFLQFKLWEIKRKESTLQVNIDFSSIVEQKKSLVDLSSDEQSQIIFLNNLTKRVLFDPSKYEKFDETYARIDITHDAGFKKLLDRLNYIANTLLYGYTLKSFGEYKEGYGKYVDELYKAEQEAKYNGKNRELNHSLAKYKQKLDEKYEKYKTFSGYELWKDYSGKEEIPDEKVKEIFCKETIYVFLNKLLFLRICEDKGFLEKNISNGGIEELRGFLKKRFKEDVINKEILEIAFKSARGLYSHFYETGILDWFRTGDGELNEILNRVLWIFNQFDFTHVDRDILGNLYEQYLPVNERKRLGEFYTPIEVIDYILTSVGYTYSNDIETKDILDPACGSGGFLVRASRRLISRYLMKFGKSDKKELRNPKNWKEIVGRLSPDEAKIILEAIQKHIYGLDINPFACHIAEMNLLFQTIDLFQKVREKDPEYKLDRFYIYRTDSLEKVSQKHLWDYTYAAFLEEQEEIDSIKQRKFDFIVGNPPYVRVHHMAKRDKDYMRQNYMAPRGDFDIYVCFIERGMEWLKKDTLLGFINSNKYLVREYGEFLRIFLLNNTEIQQIVDISNCQIFKSAAIYPVINIFKRKTEQLIKEKAITKKLKNKIDIFYIEEDGLSLLKNTPNYLRNNPNVLYYTIDQINFLDNPNFSMDIHITPEKQTILNELDKIKPKLGDISNNFCGTPRSKDYYAWGERLFEKEPIAEHCKYVVSGNISPYKIKWGIPIRSIGKHLKAPYLKYDNTLFTKKKWNIFTSKNKLIVRANDTRLTVALDQEGYSGVGIYFIIDIQTDPKYILALLNSKLMNFYYLSKFATAHVAGGYISINGVHLNKLPIKLPMTKDEKKSKDQIIKNVDKILELNKSFLEDINTIVRNVDFEKISNIPKVNFSIRDNIKFDKITLKDSKIFINKDDFIEIKDKRILEYVKIYLQKNTDDISRADDVKSLVINIPVPKSTEIINEIIDKGNIDPIKIGQQVKKLEQEIDELVYKIYGLTKKDIDIIEACLKEKEL